MAGNENHYGNDGSAIHAPIGRIPSRARKRLLLLALVLLIPVSIFPSDAPGSKTAQSQSLPSADSLAGRIADRYGADAFEKVESISYKFNVKHKGGEVERTWTWFPKQDSVLYRGKDAKGVMLTMAYSRRNRFSMGSEQVTAVDKSFVNDQYWLLFPLHLKWDKDIKLQVGPSAQAGEAHKLTVTYPSQGGYTPGDAYDLFVDSTGMIKRWVFRKGNAPEPTTQTAWSAPVEMGGLGISMEHPGPTKDFKVWFSDVKVETGS
jgi:hypothetical protein